MHLPLSALAIALLIGAATASATEPPPRVGNAAPTPIEATDARASDVKGADARAADPKAADPKAAKSPARPTKPPPRRRSVQMTVDGMPASAPPAVYAPALTPRPSPSPILTSPSVGLAPPAPVIMNSCNAGGCIGTDGQRYNGGVGSALISPQGRLCTNNGITVQC